MKPLRILSVSSDIPQIVFQQWLSNLPTPKSPEKPILSEFLQSFIPKVGVRIPEVCYQLF